MEKNAANYEIFNVGTGNPITIRHIAETVAQSYGKDIKPNITYKFRKGDIRHCFADTTKIRKKLGFKLKMSFEEGMKELIEWSKNQESVDKFNEATKYLKKHDLI
jgi:dTDP-L-rhamnose 4-epimerase